MGSYKVAGKGYVFTETRQRTSIGVIFTSTYDTKQLNPWPNSLASGVVNYSQLSDCQGDMQPFEGDLSTRRCLTSLRNKPQQNQPRKLSASMPGWIVSQHVQLLFDGETCVLLLCAWKLVFLKSGHIYVCMLHSLSGSGISVDSAPAMQALWSKGIELDNHLPITYNVCAGHYQCYDEFNAIWPSSCNLYRN